MKNTKTEQSPQSVGQNLSDTILLNMGIEKDNYPADACFGEDEKFPLVGTYSKDRQTVCIMIADNKEQEPIIPFEVVKEIAYTVKTLITDFGCAVHSYTMKNNKPFNSLKIVKPEQPEQVGHTPGEWFEIGGDSKSRYIHANKPNGDLGKIVATAHGENLEETKANARLIAAAPALFQMVKDLKNCVQRLSQDDLTQFDRDKEAQWEGEAHELLSRIDANYYRNANEITSN